MFGPLIIARTLSQPDNVHKDGERMWQYNPRSDHHSKVACWAFLFDLLLNSQAMRSHAKRGLIGFGLNHTMKDFRQNKKKDLDLVVCRYTEARRQPNKKAGALFSDLATKYKIALSATEAEALGTLPELPESRVDGVLLAVEAKAAMTAHVKACPRLYDELNSSHQIVHGDSATAIAIALVLVNAAESFISPTIAGNSDIRETVRISRHRQPNDAKRIIETVGELPRRSDSASVGFDGIAAIVVDCRNDGSPVRLVDEPPSPEIDSVYRYEVMVRRAAHLYASRFPQE